MILSKKGAAMLLLSVLLVTAAGCGKSVTSMDAGTSTSADTNTADTNKAPETDVKKQAEPPADSSTGGESPSSQTTPPANADDTQEQTSSTGKLAADQLMFGYLNESGSRILGMHTEDVNDPNRFTEAVIAPGKQVQVRYIQHQKRSGQDNGRQNLYNFDHDEGELFALSSAAIQTDTQDGILLTRHNTFKGHQFLNYTPERQGSLSQASISRIEQTRNRKIVSQGLVGQAAPDIQIGIVQFAKGSGKPLASLVLITRDHLLYRDFEGTDDEYSTWRVDDGGMMDPDLFHILFVTHSETGYSLGYEWWGAEGSNLAVLQQDGDHFRVVQEVGRYTAPL